jgi:hypothetical protein
LRGRSSDGEGLGAALRFIIIAIVFTVLYTLIISFYYFLDGKTINGLFSLVFFPILGYTFLVAVAMTT